MPVPLRIIYRGLATEMVAHIEKELRQSGFELHSESAANDDRFVALLHPDVDLVLTKLTHPDADSLASLHLIRERGLEVPLLCLVDPDQEACVLPLLQAGVTDYVITDRLLRLGPAVLRTLELQRLRQDRAAAERRLSQMLAIVDAAGGPILGFDQEGRVNRWNAAAVRLFGWSEQAILGRNLTHLAPGADLQRFQETLRRVQNAATQPLAALQRIEVTVQRADGEEIPTELALTCLEGSRPPQFLAHVRDLTHERDAEAQVALLLESMEDGVYGVDRAGNCTFINRAGAALLGYAPSEVVGRKIQSLIHMEPQHTSFTQHPLFRSDLGKLSSGIQEQILRRKDGTTFTAEYSSFPIRKEKRIQGAVVTFRDHTQTRLLESQLQQSQKMEALGRLAGGVAHDFNNLLTVIIGYSDILLAEAPLEDEAREWLTEIRHSGERAASLTAQLLAFSRKQALQPVTLNLNELVQGCVNMLRRLIGEDVVLKLEPSSSLRHVKGDARQLEQVVMNLAVNARDSMPRGGTLTISTRDVFIDAAQHAKIPQARLGPYVVLAVSDTGCGMDETTQAQIFEPFFTSKDSGAGTGLGLATVYGIVRQSDGFILIDSEVGRGSTFHVYLPRAESPEPVPQPATTRSAPRGTETILLVEDEDGVRMLARLALQGHGYTVLQASEAQTALRLFAQHGASIDLLLTDVVMPGLNGRQLADQITTHRPDIGVLFMSGYTDDALLLRGVRNEEDAFLAKPFAPADLARKVRDLLDARRTNSTPIPVALRVSEWEPTCSGR